MRRIWLVASSTLVYLFVVALPSWASHLYPPNRGHGGAGGGGGGGDDVLNPGAGGGFGNTGGFGPGGVGGQGSGNGLADTGRNFTVGFLIGVVLIVAGVVLLIRGRRKNVVAPTDTRGF